MTIEFSHDQNFHFKFELEIEGYASILHAQKSKTMTHENQCMSLKVKEQGLIVCYLVDCTSSDKGMQMTT